MNHGDLKQFAFIMYGLADNFSAKITPEGIDFRFEALKNFEIDQVKAAAVRLVKSRKFLKMPTIAEFIEAIDGTPDDRAESEAYKVLDGIRIFGSYNPPRFEDPATARIVGRMGWGNLCSMLENQQKWFVKDFMEAYKAESRRQNTGQIESAVVEDDQIRRLLDTITRSVSED